MAFEPKQKEILVAQHGKLSDIRTLPYLLRKDRRHVVVANPEDENSRYLRSITSIVGEKAIFSESDDDLWVPFDKNDSLDAYARNRSSAYYIGLFGLAGLRAGLEHVDDEQIVVLSDKKVVKSFLDFNPSGHQQRILRVDIEKNDPRPFAEYNIRILSKQRPIDIAA